MLHLHGLVNSLTVETSLAIRQLTLLTIAIVTCVDSGLISHYNHAG